MMKKYYNILILSVGSVISPLSGQQMMSSGGFYDNVMLENPAGTGMYPDSATHLQLYYKKQYNTLPDAPTHLTATFDKVLPSKKIGIGMKVQSDKFSVLTQQVVEASFAYYLLEDVGMNLDLRGNHKQVNALSMGISAGYLNRRIDGSNLVARDKDDISLWGQNPMNQHQMSLSAGVHGRWGYKDFLFQTGAAWNYFLPNLSKRDTSTTLLTNDGHAIGYVRIEFPAKRVITFEPMAIFRYNPTLALQQEYSLTMNLKPQGNRYAEYVPRIFLRGGVKTFFAKATKTQLFFATGIQIKKNIQMIYIYETPNLGLGSSNELGIHFAF